MREKEAIEILKKVREYYSMNRKGYDAVPERRVPPYEGGPLGDLQPVPVGQPDQACR